MGENIVSQNVKRDKKDKKDKREPRIFITKHPLQPLFCLSSLSI